MKSLSKTQFEIILENSYKFLNNQVQDHESHELQPIRQKIIELRDSYTAANDARKKSETPLAVKGKALSIQRARMERTIRTIWREVKYLEVDYPLLGYKTYIVNEGDSAPIHGSWSRPATRNRALQLAKGLNQIKVDGHPLPLGVGPEIIHQMVEEFDQETAAYMAAYEARATKRSHQALIRRNASKLFTLLRSNLKVYFQDLPEHLIQERIRMTGMVAVSPVASRRTDGEPPPSTNNAEGEANTTGQESNEPTAGEGSGEPDPGQGENPNPNNPTNNNNPSGAAIEGGETAAEPATPTAKIASGGAP